MKEENKEILFDSINIDYDSLYDDYCTNCTNFKEEPKDRYSEDFYEWVENQQQDIYENLMDKIKASIYDNKPISVYSKLSSQGKFFCSSNKFKGLYNAILYCIENADEFTIEHFDDDLHITVKYNNITNYYTISVSVRDYRIKLNELNL
jgi:hypothetical protein